MSESSQDFKGVDEEQGRDAPEAGSEGNTGFQDAWNDLREEDRGLLPKGGRDDQDREEAGPGAEEQPGGQERGASEASPDGQAADRTDPAASETAEDIWANADPKLKAAFQAADEARLKAENQNRSLGTRASQAQRRLNELETQVQGYRTKEAEAPKGAEGGKSREERMAALREEYPDLAAPLLDEMDALRQQVTDLTGVAASESRARTEQFYVQQEQVLDEQHPGWLAETYKPAFADWVAKQPAHVLEGLQRNSDRIVDAVEAADLFARYKADTGQAPGNSGKRDELQERRTKQLEAGRTGTVRTPPGSGGQGESFKDAWDELRDKERREASAGQGRR